MVSTTVVIYPPSIDTNIISSCKYLSSPGLVLRYSTYVSSQEHLHKALCDSIQNFVHSGTALFEYVGTILRIL